MNSVACPSYLFADIKSFSEFVDVNSSYGLLFFLLSSSALEGSNKNTVGFPLSVVIYIDYFNGFTDASSSFFNNWSERSTCDQRSNLGRPLF